MRCIVETQCIASVQMRMCHEIDHAEMHIGDAMHRVSTNQFVPQSKNLSSIIRGYKSAVTVFARKNKIDFEWHPRFHDRIIRSTFEYNNISNYIINNPAKWVEDKFYQKINPLRR